MQVTSSKMYFIGGRRVRPGTPFEIADDAKLSPDMTVVGSEAEQAEVAKATPASKGRNAAKGKTEQAKAPETFSELAKQDGAAQEPKGGAADLV